LKESIKPIKSEYIWASALLCITTVIIIVIVLFFRDSNYLSSKIFGGLLSELGLLGKWIARRRNYHSYLPQTSKVNDVVVYFIAIALGLLFVIGIVLILVFEFLLD